MYHYYLSVVLLHPLSLSYLVRLSFSLDEAAEATTATTDTTTPTEFHTADEPEDFDHWAEVLVCDLDDLEILKTRGQYCQIKFGRGSEAEIRTVRFASIQEGACSMICLELERNGGIISHNAFTISRNLSPSRGQTGKVGV